MKLFLKIAAMLVIPVAMNACGTEAEQENERLSTSSFGQLGSASQGDDSNAAHLYSLDCSAAGERDPQGFLVRRLSCTFKNPQTGVARRLSDQDVRDRVLRITKGLDFYQQDGRMIIDLEASLPESEQVRILKTNKVDIAMPNYVNHYDSLWAVIGSQFQALFVTTK